MSGIIVIVEMQGDKGMRWRGLIGALVLLTLMAIITQAGQAKEEAAELKNKTTEVKDIVNNLSAYNGTMVVIEGKIETECPSGCWFIVNDKTASIYVDILPSKIFIPPKVGSEAKVYGEVRAKEGDPMIIGKIVEIDNVIYR